MKFRHVQIDGFGMLADTGLEDIPDGLILVEGANGAGKSTFREFLISLLFGYDRTAKRYNTTRGGLRGGIATLELKSGEKLRWQRGLPPPAAGKCTATLDGEAVDPKGLMGHADRTLFGSVFALDLDQLKDEAPERDWQGAIEAAITGMDVKGLPKAIHQVDDKLKKLQKELNSAREKLQSIEVNLEETLEPARQYDEAVSLRNAAHVRLENLKEQMIELRAEERRLHRLLDAWQPWCDYEQSRVTSESLADLPKFNPNDLGKLQSLREEQARIDSVLTSARPALIEAEDALKEIERDPKILLAAEEIESLSGSIEAVRNAEILRVTQTSSVDQARVTLESTLQELGPDWDLARLARTTISRAASEEGALIAQSLQEARRRQTGRADEIAHAEEQLQEAEEEVSREAIEAPEDALSLEELDRRARTLDGLRMQFVRLEALRERRAALLVSDSPASSLIWPVAAFIVIVGIAISALAKNWLFAAFAVFVALALVALFRLRPNADSGTREAETQRLDSEIAQLEQQVEAIKSAERWTANTAADLIAIGSELLRLRDAAARRDSEQQRRKDAELRHQRAKRTLDRLKEQVSKDQDDLDALVQAWSSWREENGFPSQLDPVSYESFTRLISEAKAAARASDQRQAELAQTEAVLRNAKARLDAVADTLETSVGEQELAESIRKLVSRLKAAQEAERRYGLADQKFKECRDRVDHAILEGAANSQAIGALHTLASVDKDSTFTEVFEAWERARAAQNEVVNLRRVLAQISGPEYAVEDLIQECASIEDPAALATDHHAVSGSLTNLQVEFESVQSDWQDREMRVRVMEQGADLGRLLAARAEAVAEAERARLDCTELALMKILLAQAQKEYQTNVQVAVLKLASEYMSFLTGGEIETVVKGENGFQLVDKDGETRSVSQLNRSQAERLLFAVRLGYIDHYCEHREPLPIILDDILVNFDAEHQQFAIETIFQVAKKHQVIYLTCHTAPKTLMQETNRNFRFAQLEDWRFGVAESPMRRRPRPRRLPKDIEQPALLSSE